VEEYCWAITLGPRRSYYGRSGSSVLDFGFKLACLIYAHTVGHIKAEIKFALNSTCAGESGKELLRKMGNVCRKKSN
jgi:hypothetical protein